MLARRMTKPLRHVRRRRLHALRNVGTASTHSQCVAVPCVYVSYLPAASGSRSPLASSSPNPRGGVDASDGPTAVAATAAAVRGLAAGSGNRLTASSTTTPPLPLPLSTRSAATPSDAVFSPPAGLQTAPLAGGVAQPSPMLAAVAAASSNAEAATILEAAIAAAVQERMRESEAASRRRLDKAQAKVRASEHALV